MNMYDGKEVMADKKTSSENALHEDVQNLTEALEKEMRAEDVDHGNVVTHSTTNRHTNSTDYLNQKFQPPQLYKNADSEKNGGIAAQVGGYGLAAAGGVISGVNILALLGGAALGGIPGLLIGGAALVGGLILGVSGSKKTLRANRFKEYVDILGQKTMMPLEELSVETGKTKRFLTKDLEDMNARHLFRQGHLDKENGTLITADETYRNYLKYQKQQEKKALVDKKEEDAFRDAGLSTEGIRIIRALREHVKKIDALNAEIDDPEITGKLELLCGTIGGLSEEVQKQPFRASDLRRLDNYYLPTLEKLLGTYITSRRENMKTKDSLKTETEIETLLDTVNSSFSNLLRNFLESRSIDVSADITVMNSMLSSEGLNKENLINVTNNK